MSAAGVEDRAVRPTLDDRRSSTVGRLRDIGGHNEQVLRIIVET